MAWIQVTDLVGRTVYLSTEQVVRVRPFVPANDAPPASGSHGPHDHKDIDMTSAKSVVDLVNVQQAVREPPDEILKRIKVAVLQEAQEAGA